MPIDNPGDTPRTDAVKFPIFSDLQSGTRDVVDAEHARTLERELAAAVQRKAEVIKQIPSQISKMQAEFAPEMERLHAELAAEKQAHHDKEEHLTLGNLRLRDELAENKEIIREAVGQIFVLLDEVNRHRARLGKPLLNHVSLIPDKK